MSLDLKITHPASSSDQCVKVCTHVDAVKALPSNFTSKEVAPIMRCMNHKLVGQVKALFIVLSDDQLREQLRCFEKKNRSTETGAAGSQVPDKVAGSKSGSCPVPTGSHFSRSGSNKRGAPLSSVELPKRENLSFFTLVLPKSVSL